jgi:hypothetical protein
MCNRRNFKRIKKMKKKNETIYKKELYKIMDEWADEKEITRGILISLKDKINEEIKNDNNKL